MQISGRKSKFIYGKQPNEPPLQAPPPLQADRASTMASGSGFAPPPYWGMALHRGAPSHGLCFHPYSLQMSKWPSLLFLVYRHLPDSTGWNWYMTTAICRLRGKMASRLQNHIRKPQYSSLPPPQNDRPWHGRSVRIEAPALSAPNRRIVKWIKLYTLLVVKERL